MSVYEKSQHSNVLTAVQMLVNLNSFKIMCLVGQKKVFCLVKISHTERVAALSYSVGGDTGTRACLRARRRRQKKELPAEYSDDEQPELAAVTNPQTKVGEWKSSKSGFSAVSCLLVRI